MVLGAPSSNKRSTMLRLCVVVLLNVFVVWPSVRGANWQYWLRDGVVV